MLERVSWELGSMVAIVIGRGAFWGMEFDTEFGVDVTPRRMQGFGI